MFDKRRKNDHFGCGFSNEVALRVINVINEALGNVGFCPGCRLNLCSSIVVNLLEKEYGKSVADAFDEYMENILILAKAEHAKRKC